MLFDLWSFGRRLSAALSIALPLAFLPLFEAAAAPGPATQQDVGQTYSGSLIWQVEKDGQPPSYLYGTIHSTDPRLQELPAEVRDAFDASQAAAFELIFDAEAEAEMQRAALQPNGRRLEDVIGPELFGRTAEAVAVYGIPPEALQNLTLLAIVGLLTYPLEELQRIGQGAPILDTWLQQEARRRGKRIHGLESAAEQIDLFTEMSGDEKAVLVTDLLHDRARQAFARMLAAYLAGDTEAIMAEVYDFSAVSDKAAAARFLKRVLDDRNHTMVERMLPLMAEGSTFVAVGAGHLGGEQGILRLLEARGYRVTRLP